MDVSTDAELLAPAGSPVVALTEALLVITPACVGFTTMSIVAVAPLPIVPSSQIMSGSSAQVPWLRFAETKVTLDGKVS
jgi:hypothetical protein